MLQLKVILSESFDEASEEFVTEEVTLQLEHSLLSLSKWESKYEKPFLSDKEKSAAEIVDYVTMMDLSPETPTEVYASLSNENFHQINDYINSKQTATWFSKKGPNKKQTQTVTSELIYYWITTYEIPWVVETWHIGRLFTLIEVFNEERSKDKKPERKSGESMAAERRRLNEERKRAANSTG